MDRRRILDGILFQLRTGCRWNHLPPVYGSDSTIHRYFKIWLATGIFEKVWAVLLEASPELASVWQPPPTPPSSDREGQGNGH